MNVLSTRLPLFCTCFSDKWIIFVVHILLTICVLLTADFDGRFAKPMYYILRKTSVQSWVGRRGLEWEGGNQGEETVATSGSVSSVVVRCWEATAVTMIQYNGEIWRYQRLGLLSTPTEIWTGHKTATGFWSHCRYWCFLDITQWSYRNLCHPGPEEDKGAWNYTDGGWSWHLASNSK